MADRIQTQADIERAWLDLTYRFTRADLLVARQFAQSALDLAQDEIGTAAHRLR